MKASRIIGHRGLASLAPENTLASIKTAGQHNIDWLELDASILGDDTVVLCHDDTLDRCSNSRGSLLHINYEHLQNVDAGAWFCETFHGERIPTLATALQLISSLNMGLNLELKPQEDISPQKITSLIHPIITSHWRSNKPLLISSFDHDILRYYRQLDSEQPLGLLYESISSCWHNTAQEINAVSVNCDWQHLTASLAHSITSAGYQLIIYTCNDSDIAKNLWNMGVDSVISDTPHLL
jgi:glycerophosphoryl diester phosphodiesterase